MMKPVHTFTVVPSLPLAIENLREVAYNLSWCWSHDSITLFRRLDSDLWETCGHNPVLLLGTIELCQQLLDLQDKRPRRRLTAVHKVFWVALRRF